MYVVTLDGIADEVELDSDVSSSEGGLSGGGNGHTGLIVFANECWAIKGMTKFGQQHSQEDCFSCCETNRNVFGFNSGLGNS